MSRRNHKFFAFNTRNHPLLSAFVGASISANGGRVILKELPLPKLWDKAEQELDELCYGQSMKAEWLGMQADEGYEVRLHDCRLDCYRVLDAIY